MSAAFEALGAKQNEIEKKLEMYLGGDHWITETWEDNSLVPRLEEEEEHTSQPLLPKQNVKSNTGGIRSQFCKISKHSRPICTYKLSANIFYFGVKNRTHRRHFHQKMFDI